MNLGKMIAIINQNHDGAIVNVEKETNNLNIDVRIKYLAKHIDETYSLMKYKIINFIKIEFKFDDKTEYEEIDVVKKMGLIIYSAEVGKERSLLIKVRSTENNYGKIHIWLDEQNDIKIYDQTDSEIEYDRFIRLCKKEPVKIPNSVKAE